MELPGEFRKRGEALNNGFDLKLFHGYALFSPRFLPELSEQARMTLLAFKSKGLDLNGGLRHKARIISLILPTLFVNAFKRSDVTAAALNVKGYATRYKKAVLPAWRFTFGDLITILASVVILITGWRTA